MSNVADALRAEIEARQEHVSRTRVDVARQQQAVEETVNAIVEQVLMTEEDWDQVRMHAGGPRFSPMRFDGALPLIKPELMDSASAERFYFMDVAPTDLDYPLSVTLLFALAPQTGEETLADRGMVLERFEQVSLADVRGLVKHVSRWMVELDMALFPVDEDPYGIRVICGSIGPNEKIGLSLKEGTTGIAGTSHVWMPNFPDGSLPDKAYISSFTDRINLAYCVAFTSRYDWHVRVGYDGMPRLRIPTDEHGVRALFGNRDIAEGRNRRSALKHWVGQHWRRNPFAEGETESLVRQYLRGEVEFGWNGFRCTLEPSRFDLDKNEELRRARNAIRKEQEAARKAARAAARRR